MKFLKALLTVVVLSSPSWALFGNNGGPDYSSNAGNTFICASTGTVLTQAGVSASSPTWILTNPPSSGKNLIILDVGVAIMAAPAAAAQFSIGLSTNVAAPSTTTVYNTLTPGVVVPALVGKSSTTVVGLCTMQGGLQSVPRSIRYIGGTTGAAAISGVVISDPTQGKIVVNPGNAISLQSSSAASVQSHVEWMEVPQ